MFKLMADYIDKTEAKLVLEDFDLCRHAENRRPAGNRMTVYISHRDEVLPFKVSSTTPPLDLRDRVAKRIGLSLGYVTILNSENKSINEFWTLAGARVRDGDVLTIKDTMQVAPRQILYPTMVFHAKNVAHRIFEK